MFSLIKIHQSTRNNVYEFICDTKNDLPLLPNITTKVAGFGKASAGSVAFVADENTRYLLGNDNVWRKTNTSPFEKLF